MRTQLLIASEDSSYTDHLSDYLLEQHKTVFDVIVCSGEHNLQEQLASKKIDIALLEASMFANANLKSVHLPLLLWSEGDDCNEVPENITRIRKYQRISTMVSNVLEIYAKGLSKLRNPDARRARISAFWSPVGGVGKTTVALAYSAGKRQNGKEVLYLDFEQFSSVRTYFNDSGKSISTLFDMLESDDGDIKTLIQSISKEDRDSGITYICRPENYDDMNILSIENMEVLMDACSELTDELVIDMSSICDGRTQRIFELADRIFLVSDPSHSSQMKFEQFVSQNNLFQRIRDKTTLVANKGAAPYVDMVNTVVSLPLIRSLDPITVYRALSRVEFELLNSPFGIPVSGTAFTSEV